MLWNSMRELKSLNHSTTKLCQPSISVAHLCMDLQCD